MKSPEREPVKVLLKRFSNFLITLLYYKLFLQSNQNETRYGKCKIFFNENLLAFIKNDIVINIENMNIPPNP